MCVRGRKRMFVKDEEVENESEKRFVCVLERKQSNEREDMCEMRVRERGGERER